MHCIILTAEKLRDRFLKEFQRVDLSKADISFAFNKDQLLQLFEREGASFDYLISFSTSIIVPKDCLKRPNQINLNIHAASPDYPGRDPHHYAVYDNVNTYGATLHFMTEKVDEGAIIEVESFKVPEQVSPKVLLELADQAAWKLIRRLLTRIKKEETLEPSEMKWSGVKRSRPDFNRYCKIDVHMDESEVSRRIKAFHVEGHNNLYAEIGGRRFYYLETSKISKK